MLPATFRNLTDRRLPQFVAVYIGAAWGLVQFVDFITRYGLSPRWTDLTILAVVLLLPSVILYTYHHGRPGRDRWQRSEKIFIPVNVVLLGGVLTFVGAGSNLGAVTTKVTLKDEKGNTIERVVPNKAYRKRVALFMFDAVKPELRWLQLGVPVLAAVDLQQQQFIQIVPGPAFREELRQKGYREGVNIPLGLKRSLAEERQIPYFVAGTVDRTGANVTATVQLYETATAKLLKQRTFTAEDPASVADMISERLLSDLDVPVLADRKPDMPVSEITTSNPAALRAYMDAITALVNDDNWGIAKTRLDEAVKIDPSFATAHMQRYVASMLSGAPADAQASIKAALDHSYRLPERAQHYAKAYYYQSQRDFPRSFAVFDMLAQLYPDDIEVHQNMVIVQRERGNHDGMIAAMRKVLELDPSQSEMLLSLGEVYERKGDTKAAIAEYKQYAQRHPKDVRGMRALANLYRTTGQHAQARAEYERASLSEPDDARTQVALAELEYNLGNFAQAQQAIQNALSSSRTAEDRFVAYEALADFYSFTGEMAKRVQAMEAMLAELTKFAPPQQVLLYQMGLPRAYAYTNPSKAHAVLQRLRQQLKSPFDVFLPIAELRLYDVLEDADAEEKAVAAVEQLIEQTGIKILKPMALFGRGRVNEIRGNCGEAIRWFEETAKLEPLSINHPVAIGRCYRKLDKRAEAEKALARALRVAPASGTANLEMALLYKAAGDDARAQQHAARARATWKNADPGYKLLKELNSI